MAATFVNYTELLADVETLTQSLHRKFVNEITCHLGCTSCCYQQLSLFQIEADFIAKALKDLPVETQRKLLLTANQIKPDSSSLEACPMLDGFGCSIYQFRPIICRTHGFPITFKDEDSEELFLDVCPLNFSEEGDAVELNLTDTINIDRLNLRLAAVNYAYCRDILGDAQKSAHRHPMFEIIISTLTNLPL